VNPIVAIGHALARIPLLGTALFLVLDAMILLVVTLFDPWLGGVRDRTHISLHDATNLGFADECFDAVTAISTIEHIEDDRAVIAEIARVLKTGGLAIVTVPVNPEYYEVRDNPSFPLIRHYDLETLEQRFFSAPALSKRDLQLWCIRDRYGELPLWTFTRFSDVLRRFVYYRKLKPPYDACRIAPNPVGHQIAILALRKNG